MFGKISRHELINLLETGQDFILVDTLPERIYRAGHIPGAINIVSDEIIVVAANRLPNKDRMIVVYCADGPCRRSALAAARLADLGYTSVFDYHEGKADWTAAKLPIEVGPDRSIAQRP